MATAEMPPMTDEEATSLRRRLADALAAWSQAIGDEHVQASKAVCERYGRSTSPWSNEPIAILRPGKVFEVQEIVRIAAQFRISLYPISGGKNWGMGDACPTTSGQVIVDLRRLNAIREVNSELGYAVIEAGVTQRQLYDFLAENAPCLALDVTGAGPYATIVGNVIERGFGHSPYGDRFHNSCNYEVVLADGTLYRTGFGGFDNAKSAHLLKAGLGPSLDGLFTQSNLGIITAMTVWLLPKADYTEAFAFKVDNDSRLAEIVDALRPLRLSGVLRSTIHIANDLRLISSRTPYPYEATGGATPLPDEVRMRLRARYGVGAWNVLGGIYGTRSMVRGARSELRRVLRGIATPKFINERRLSFANKIALKLPKFAVCERLRSILPSINSAYALLKGEPVEEHLRGVSWRTRAADEVQLGLDPLEKGDGFVWLSPTLPMTGSDASVIQNTLSEISSRYSFEPLMTFVSISGRAMCCPITISFDRGSKLQVRNAAHCYEELLETMLRLGYIPYRLGIQSMGRLSAKVRIPAAIINKPSDLSTCSIFAPGRYGG